MRKEFICGGREATETLSELMTVFVLEMEIII